MLRQLIDSGLRQQPIQTAGPTWSGLLSKKEKDIRKYDLWGVVRIMFLVCDKRREKYIMREIIRRYQGICSKQHAPIEREDFLSSRRKNKAACEKESRDFLSGFRRPASHISCYRAKIQKSSKNIRQ